MTQNYSRLGGVEMIEGNLAGEGFRDG